MSNYVTSPDAFLFDIGNVLIEIDTDNAFEYWSTTSGVPVDALRNRFVMDDVYHEFEIGKIDAEVYLNHLRRQLNIDIDDGALLNGWNAILLDEIPGIHSMMERLSQISPIYAFSNTNVAHQELWSQRLAHILELCESVFTSWEIGLRKPDVEAFLHVAKKMQLEPENVLFFDDSNENISGARTAGMQTVHVTETSDTFQAVSSFIIEIAET